MKYIIGNWKMNMLPNEAINFCIEYTENVKGVNNKLILAVPFVNMFYANNFVQDTNVQIAAQNMHFENSGAYTGEISASMLKSIGVDYCIIGHSERREYFNETNEILNKKVRQAITNSITPIFCVGENLTENESGNTKEIIRVQIEEGLKDLSNFENIDNTLIVAYEPIWAIGTGKVCDSNFANEITTHIKEVVKEIYPDLNVVTLYGGSVTSLNSNEILSKENIDGVLVGGASLKADEFTKISKF